jgi:hypothetical protein
MFSDREKSLTLADVSKVFTTTVHARLSVRSMKLVIEHAGVQDGPVVEQARQGPKEMETRNSGSLVNGNPGSCPWMSLAAFNEAPTSGVRQTDEHIMWNSQTNSPSLYAHATLASYKKSFEGKLKGEPPSCRRAFIFIFLLSCAACLKVAAQRGITQPLMSVSRPSLLASR